MTVSVDTVTRQQLEIKRLTEHVNALKKKGGTVTARFPGTGGNNTPQCKHCAELGRTAPHQNNKCYLNPRKNKERKGLAKRLIEAKGFLFNDE